MSQASLSRMSNDPDLIRLDRRRRVLPGLWLVGLGCITVLPACREAAPDLRTLADYGVALVPQSEWSEFVPGGYPGNGIRRNLAAGDSVSWRDLALSVVDIKSDSTGKDAALLAVGRGGASLHAGWTTEDSRLDAGPYQIAILAVRTDSTELGSGLTEIEIVLRSEVPDSVAATDSAGAASHRLRVPHDIRSVVLHHSGDAEPLRPDDDVVDKLRRLQEWSRTDRNWWDLPYHFLVDLDGRFYEGRDYRYAGDTNTRYDPRGHLLVSVIGNYNLQEPTQAQVDALSRFFAWAMQELDVPTDSIRGHSDLADTSCPGDNWRRYLRDGTLVARARTVAEIL